MTRFQDFTKDNGTPITVEYSAIGGEPDFDYPGHVCDGGGSGPEIVIVKAWPNTSWHNRLAVASLRLMVGNNRTKLGWKLAAALRWPVDLLMRADAWWRASLTPAEDERMSAWLAEHFIEESFEEDWR